MSNPPRPDDPSLSGGEFNDFEGLLDNLFQEAEFPAKRTAPDVSVVIDGFGRTALIPAEPQAFRDKIETDMAQVEKMLGLNPREAAHPIAPGRVLDEAAIEKMLRESAMFCPIKPDQADPVLARLPGQARAGEVRHSILAAPSLGRIDRLREVNSLYRKRGDSVICREIQRFFAAPRRDFSRAGELSREGLLTLSDKFEELIDEGMNAISGSQGHWDRDSRWPSALLLLQAMSVACRVAGGRQESLLELASIDRNMSNFDLLFMETHLDSYRVSLKRMGIDLSKVIGGL